MLYAFFSLAFSVTDIFTPLTLTLGALRQQEYTTSPSTSSWVEVNREKINIVNIVISKNKMVSIWAYKRNRDPVVETMSLSKIGTSPYGDLVLACLKNVQEHLQAATPTILQTYCDIINASRLPLAKL